MRAFLRRLATLFRRRRLERDLDDELAFHLAMREAEQRGTGLRSGEAEKAARRQFGNVLLLKEQTRDAWTFRWLESVLQDIRFAMRGFRRSSGFTLIATLTLAIGIGVSNTGFGIVNGALIRELPFAQADRLVYVGLRESRSRWGGVSHPEYRDLQAVRSIRLAAYTDAPMVVAEEDRSPDRLQGAYVSAGAFELLTVSPAMGRGILAEDDTFGAASVAVLSHAVWRSRYQADRTLVGRVVRVNGSPSTIVGVMPEGFGFPTNTDVWQPLAQMPDSAARARGRRTLGVVGRLADDRAFAEARQEVEAVAARLRQEHPETNKNVDALVIPLKDRYVATEVKRIILVLLGAALLVLLIACVNVSNLLLARAVYRRHEIAIRVAIGATRWRIARQLLVESVLMASAAGVLALGLSAIGIRLCSAAIAATTPPFWLHFELDWRVFVFLGAISLGSSVIFGLMPALHVSRWHLPQGLQAGNRTGPHGLRARRWTGALVAVELALTLVLLTSAGLMLRAFWSLYNTDLGIDTRGVTVMRLDMSGAKYSTAQQRGAFVDRLEERLRTIPILAGAIATSPPGGGGPQQWALSMEGHAENPGEKPPLVTMVAISNDYFRALHQSMIRGRSFVSTDGTPGHDHAIVNERFASRYFPAADPIGRHIRVSRAGNPPTSSGWVNIVGVAPTVSQQNALLQNEPDPVVYLPYRAQPSRSAVLLARGPEDVGSIATQIRAELLALDSDLPVFDVQSLDQFLAFFRWPQRVFGGVLAILAGIALILAVVGLYGVTAYSVAQRTHEIGVRMAVGARSAHVLFLVLQRALVPFGVGLLVGLGGALAIGRLFTAFLVGTSPTDPATLFTVAAILVGTGLVACVLPAYRASRFEPLLALRHE